MWPSTSPGGGNWDTGILGHWDTERVVKTSVNKRSDQEIDHNEKRINWCSRVNKCDMCLAELPDDKA